MYMKIKKYLFKKVENKALAFILVKSFNIVRN